MMFTVAGIAAQSEFSTNYGRIDIVVELASIIYIIEVKLNQPATKALEQIEARTYYERFLHKNKAVMLLGLSFQHESGIFEVEYAARELL
jgi:PD-(D/E)XK nuclease superfamily